MTSKFKKVLSSVLALLMVLSPLTASMADDAEYYEETTEQTEVYSEPVVEEPPVVEAPPVEEPPVVEAPPATEVPASEPPAAEPQVDESVPGGEEYVSDGNEPQNDVVFDDAPQGGFGGFGGWDEGPSYEGMPESTATPVPTPEPVYAVGFDMSHVVNPVSVPFGTPEGALPLPAGLSAVFSNGQTAEVPVIWYCTGNTYDGQGYIPECEMYEVMFYFQATPVGISCDPGMILPVVTVMYEAKAEPTDHEGICFQGTDIVVTGSVTTDDILNEAGYDASYRIVNTGTISAGASGRAIPNPVLLTGAIAGGTFNGRVECENGMIRGGRFNGDVGGPNGNILVTIEGGEFRGNVGDGDGAGYIYIEGGAFYGDVSAYSLAVDDGASLPVFYNADGERGAQRIVTVGAAGVIADGKFYADVRNANNITGGEYHGRVSNRGAVLGGVFLSDFENLAGGRIAAPAGGASGAVFPNAVNLSNSGTIDAGEAVRFSAEMIVTNNGDGTIVSGAFPCRVLNYGTIAGGTFAGDVVNMGAIHGGDFQGQMYNEGGTIAGATLNCRLMSNTGLITLQSIVAEPEDKVVTISADTTATTNQILETIIGDASEYTILNDGEITGGSAVLPCNFDEKSTGSITGGTFSGRVYANEISGGVFTGYVHANAITNGEFDGRVNAYNVIRGGGFTQNSVVTAGVISGGTFGGRVTSADREKAGFVTITGGTFNGGVATVANDGIVINGGTFNCNVGYCANAERDVYDGYVIIRKADGVEAPRFTEYCSYVGGHNVVIECGSFSANTKVVMYSMGSLVGGDFRGPVICNNAILGGEYHGEVTINSKPNGQIHGGTFYGTVYNKEGAYISQDGYKDYPPPKFLGGEIENEGTMDPGDGAEFGPEVQIINQPTGVIKSGVYSAPVTNFGKISMGTFKAPVTTYNSIDTEAEGPMFEDFVINAPAQTIEIPAGVTKSIQNIKTTNGYSAASKIVNKGTITGGEGDVLPNEVENKGVIQGGKFTGTVRLVGYEDRLLDGGRIQGGAFSGTIYSYYGVISGGTFDGNVALDETDTLVVTIVGGTFNGTVGRSGDGYVFVYRADDSKKVLDEVDASGPVFNQKVAARNLNITCGTFNGPVEMSTVGVIANGAFHGPVVCHNNITGGEFFETVEVCKGQNSHIEGGVFHKGTTIENGTAVQRAEDTEGEAIAFDGGEIVNSGILDPGDGAVFGEGVTIHNTETGRILSGNYNGPVMNEGLISGATFFGAVENHSRIINSSLLGTVSGPGTSTVEGVTVEGKTITIEAGKSVTVGNILSLINNESLEGYTILNNGTFSGTGASIPCDVYGGTISGGKYTGTVCVGKISDGTFSGTTLAQTIVKGAFSGTVYAKAISGGSFDGAVHDYCNDSIGSLPAELKAKAKTYLATAKIPDATKGGLAIGGGNFNGTVGGSGEPVFIHGGNFENCRGLKADNLTVDKGLTTRFGASCAVEFVKGDIAGGIFDGTVTNNNNVTGGTFNGNFVNRGTVYGGTFNGGIDNYGTINGGATYVGYDKWSFDNSRYQWVPEGQPTTKQVTDNPVTIACDLHNKQGGVVKGTVNKGEGYARHDEGGVFEASALIATPDGQSQIYSGAPMVCGAPVLQSLAAIDEKERVTSKWSYLDGRAIGAAATISDDPAENAFLRDFDWNVQNGELQLGMDWSRDALPNAEYSSVRILAGATVSGGTWDVPVINEGNITGGTFNKELNNYGSVKNAAINGRITASAGTIEDCTYGASASVASVAEGARIRVKITVNSDECVSVYGAKALNVLAAIQTKSGYDWYSVGGAEAVVKSADIIPLSGGKYELRKRPVPEIIWPTASPIGAGEPLSASKLTSSDVNGTFSWKNPTYSYKTPGTARSTVVYTPNPDNGYNYEGIETTKQIELEIKDNIIVIAVNNASKLYMEDENPSRWSAKVTGCKTQADLNQLKYTIEREAGQDVGNYAMTVKVTAKPANYNVHIVPGTFTINAKPLTEGVLYNIIMGAVSYTGEVLKPVPTVKDNLKYVMLTEGKDFTVSYNREVLEPGPYTYTVTGKGNYAGSVTKEFSVALGNAEVAIQSYTKTYGDPDPKFESTCTGVSEKAGFRYEIYRIEGEKVGTYSILARQLSGDNVRLSTKGGTLKIVPKQIPATITVPGTHTYTGSAIAPKPVVKDGGATLVEGTDYTLSYENNVNAGVNTAIVVVTGKGNYTGTQRAKFSIGKADAEIIANDATKPLGAKDPAFTATVTGALKGEKLNYTFKREAGEKLGTYAITVTPGSNPNYDVEVEPGKLTITPEPTQLTLTPATLKLTEGESASLTATLLPTGTESVLTLTSSNAKAANPTLDGGMKTGAVTIAVQSLKPGASTITVKTANGLSATCQLTVLPKVQSVTIGYGDKLTLVPEDKSATTFDSSDKAVATVDNKGVVTTKAQKGGKTAITASVNGVQLAKWDLNVTPAPDKVVISSTSATVGVGQDLSLTAKINNGAASAITWTTNNSKVATVDASGNVKTLAAGSAKITAKTYNNKSAVCTVTVKAAPTSAKLDQSTMTLGCGEKSKDVKLTLSNNSATTYRCESTDPNIATITINGKAEGSIVASNKIIGQIVAGNKTGKATVSVTTHNGKTANCTVEVLPAPGKISLGENVTMSAGQSLTLNPVLEPANARNVLTYTSSDKTKKLATVDAKGVVKLLKAGTVTITAEAYNGTKGSVNITIVPAASKVTMAPTKASIGEGETLQLSATVTGGNNEPLTWTSNKEAVAKVDRATGKVTAQKAGTATITATTYNGKKATCAITVTKAPDSVTLNITSVTLGCGETWGTAVKTPLSPKNSVSAISYTSTDEGIAKIKDGKIVAGNKTGKATITATTYNGKTANCTVEVLPAPGKINLGEDVTMSAGQSLTLNPVLEPVNARNVLTYTSSDKTKKLATVDAKGVVKLLKAGTVTITAKAYNGTTDSVSITILAAPSKVTMTPTKASIGEGETLQLSAKVTGGNNEPLTWTSNKEAVAKVDRATGKVTAQKAGTATITVATYNNKKATCAITVTKAPDSVALNITSVTLGCGETWGTAVKTPLSPKNSVSAISYTSTDEGIAKIKDGKIVAGNKTGKATITATTYNGKTANCTVEVLPAPGKINLGEDVTMSAGQSLTLNPVLEPANARNVLTYTSSDKTKKLATVDAKGVVKLLKAGTVTITAKAYNGTTDSVKITILTAPSKVTMSATKATLGVGETLQLSAKVTGGNNEPLTWTSNKGTVATVSSDGTVKPLAKGTATITVATYNGKKATCAVTVSEAPTSIALSLTEVTMGVGETAKALKATLSSKSASAINYKYDEKVITLANGKITPKAPGTTTIQATTFNGLSAECKVTVEAAPTAVDLGANQSLKVKEILTLQPKFQNNEGGTVTYKSSNTGVATVDASGKVTAKKAGNAVITVTTYNKKTDTVTITVTK